jgi:multidrug resistance efflux pump
MARNISKPIRICVTLIAVGLAVVTLVFMFRSYLFHPWTRDGQVQALVVQITPRVSGPVIELPIVDNQAVKTGELLFKIDPRTFEAQVAQAKASVAQAKASAAEAKDKADRAKELYRKDVGAISKQNLVAKENEQLMAEASVEVAKANLQSAELDLEFTEVRAPVDGYVTNLELQIGSNFAANQAALALIDRNSYWVYGFFKETQMKHIKLGDRVIVKLMSYPDKPIVSEVESIGWGIYQSDGSAGDDLLPSIDASFDWIRLAQRVPVRVRLGKIPEGVKLIVGTTASVFVMTEEEE